MTAASTTTSVRASAWTTGSTAGVWFGDVVEVRRDRAGNVPDPEQQDVGRGLDDDQADDLVDQVAAGHDAVQPDPEDPGHDDEREVLHHPPPCRMSSVCSSSSPMMRMNVAPTSRPTKKLISEIVPDELTAPGVCPSGR